MMTRPRAFEASVASLTNMSSIFEMKLVDPKHNVTKLVSSPNIIGTPHVNTWHYNQHYRISLRGNLNNSTAPIV
jgi:hypothetical protein